ncbi:hypothetical protein X735_32185 [Mesorhizobium sp. L2C085B000]|nr:hypothetical protein X735_32185 [Mesorhizobium sp. L2C085B000]
MAVGPRWGDRRLDGGIILSDAVGERGDQAGACPFEPFVQLRQLPPSDNALKAGDDLASFYEEGYSDLDRRHHEVWALDRFWRPIVNSRAKARADDAGLTV